MDNLIKTKTSAFTCRNNNNNNTNGRFIQIRDNGEICGTANVRSGSVRAFRDRGINGKAARGGKRRSNRRTFGITRPLRAAVRTDHRVVGAARTF